MMLPLPTSVDPSPITERTGAARLAYRVQGVVEILGVGLLVPVVILAIGAPIAIAVQFVMDRLFGR